MSGFYGNNQNKTEYIPISELAREFGYDIDHISRLCRQDKIDAIREANGRWLATKESLTAYQESARRVKQEIAAKNLSPRPVRTSSFGARPKSFPREGALAPSSSLRISDRMPGRVNFSASTRSVLKFALLGIFVFVASSSIFAFAKNDDFKNSLKKIGQELAEIVIPHFKLTQDQKQITFTFRTEKFLNFKNLADEFDLALYNFQSLSQNYSANLFNLYLSPIFNPVSNLWGRLFKEDQTDTAELNKQIEELKKQLSDTHFKISNNEKIIEEKIKEGILVQENQIIRETDQEKTTVTERRIVTIPSNMETRLLSVERLSQGNEQRFKTIELTLAGIDNRFSYTPTILVPSGGGGGNQGITISNPATTDSETVKVSKLLDVTGNAQIAGSLNLDSGTFYVNPTDNRVGIGTTNLETAFEISGTASISNDLFVLGRLGIGTTSPTTKLEVQGTASASYLLTSNTLQVGGFASVAYSRFGTSTTGHSNYISTTNDVLVSGDIEVRGTASFGANASISGDLLVFGKIGIGTTALPNQLTVIGSGSFTGQLKATRNPTIAHTGTWPSFTNTNDATLYINPSSPVADGNVIAYTNGSDPKFVVDAEGDVFAAGNLTLVGTTTQATTNVTGDLSVEGNARLGDAVTDKIKLTGTVLPYTLSSFPLLVKASASQTVDLFRIRDSSDNTVFTVDQNTGLLTASSGFNFYSGFSTATVSYSRLGTATTGYSSDIDKFNDLLISGALEVDGNTFFDGKASISGNFQTAGRFIFGDSGDTGEINTSDWDISNTGNLSGIGTINADGAYTQTGTGANTFSGATTFSSSGTALTVDNNATITGRLGIGGATNTKLEVQGTASASYLLTGNTLQVGGFASAAYSRFGTATATSSLISTTNDLLISGNLEVDSEAFFDSAASISGNFQTAGRFIFGDSGDTGEINTSDWDISNTGNLSGIGTIAADGAYTQTGTGANTFSGATTFSSTGNALLVSAGRAEVQGTASASYLLTGNTLQVGGFASAAYSRFGTATTDYSTFIDTTNDLLISGSLEVDSDSFFDGNASISGNFELTGSSAKLGLNAGAIINTNLEVGGTASISGATTLRGVTYTWPSADGSSSQFLRTNGSGTLSWATAGVASNSLDFDEFVNTMLLDADLTINRGGFKIGIGAAPSTVFEVQGTASASYLLTGNTLQVGGFASAAYSRFGTATTTHAGSITTTNDLLISGDLEVDASAAFDGIFRVGSGPALYSDGTDVGMGIVASSTWRLTLNDAFGQLAIRDSDNGKIWWFDTANNADFRIGENAEADANARLVLEAGGDVGIGTVTPLYKLHVRGDTAGSTVSSALHHADNTNGASHARLVIQVGGASGGDPFILYTGTSEWSVGIDNSDSDKYKVSFSDGLGVNDRLTVLTTGQTGINDNTPDAFFDVAGSGLFDNELIVTEGLQVGGATSVAYSRFGTTTTTHSNYISASNDILISGDLEGRASLTFAGVASLSNALWVSPGGYSGNVGVGTRSPKSRLYVDVGFPTNTTVGTKDAGLTQGFNGIYVANRYIYAVSDHSTNSDLVIFEASNPASISIESTTNIASSARFNSIVVNGKYAYIGGYTDDLIHVFDVSNPKAPVRVGTVAAQDSNWRIYLQGRYLYVVDAGASKLLEIFDISNPASPVSVGSVSTTDFAYSVYVQGKYAYVATSNSTTTHALRIFNIANPASPYQVGTVTVSTTNTDVLRDLYVQGRYAYILGEVSNKLYVVNVSDPATPTNLTNIATTDSGPYKISAQEKYLYVSSPNTVETFDVSIPHSPVSVGSFTMGGNDAQPYSIVQGRYLYHVTSSDTVFEIYEPGGAYIQQAEFGGVETGTLTINSTGYVGHDFGVRGGLTVGQGAYISGPFSVYASASRTAFSVNNNGNIGINTISPQTLFEVQGTASASYLLTGNTLQVGGFSSVAYSRFGTNTTSYSNDLSTTNDLLISGNLEVDLKSYFDAPGEFQGTASASYLLTGNTLQVGGFASVAYSRFGTATTGYTNFITTTNDLLISGDLEVDGSANFDTFLRVGTNATPALFADAATGNVGIGTTKNGTDALVEIRKNQNTITPLVIQNNSAGGAARTTLVVGAGFSGSSEYGTFEYFGSGYTTDGVFQARRVFARAIDTGGLWLEAENSSGVIGFVTGGSAAVNERMRIDSAGRVGIKTTTPQTLFEVQGTASASYLLTGNTLQVGGFASVAYNRFGTDTTGYTNFITTTNDILISGDLEVNATATFDSFVQIAAPATANTTALCWDNSGASLIYDCNGSATDLAENFGTEDTSIEAGDLVSIDPNRKAESFYKPDANGNNVYTSKAWITKTTGPNDLNILGVISTQPNQVYGEDGVFKDADNPRPVSLVGRVPVKVNLENGPIKAGDRLTSSSVPGVGMKAAKAGQTIGLALEPLDSVASGSYEKIVAFINLGYWSPAINTETLTSDSGAPSTSSGQAIFDLDTLFNSIVAKFNEAMNIVFEKGLLKIANIVVEKLTAKEVAADKICIGQTCVTEQELKALLEQSGIQNIAPSSSNTPTPTPEATLSPTPEATPTPSPEPSPSSSESPAPSPEPTPGPEPKPSPEPTPTLSPTSEPTPEPTPEITPTPEPIK